MVQRQYLFEIAIRDDTNKEVDSKMILDEIAKIAGIDMTGFHTLQSRFGDFNYGIVVYEDTKIDITKLTVIKANMKLKSWHKGDL